MKINNLFEPNDPDRQPFRPGIPDQISPEEFNRLLVAGKIVDGRSGGILLGKPADEGGTRGIFKIGGDYLIQGRYSGGDFVLNTAAAAASARFGIPLLHTGD